MTVPTDSDSLIQYLSSEIENVTSNIMTFRWRISLTLFIGPYFLLGSIIVGTRGSFTLAIHSTRVLLAILVFSAMHYVLGVAAGHIEMNAWRQCEKWRRSIINLADIPDDKKDALQEQIGYRGLGDKVLRGYYIGFALILVSLWAFVYIVANIFPTAIIPPAVGGG